MKIKARRQFKDDYHKLKKTKPLIKALQQAISMLQLETDISATFTINRLTAMGTGWHACYLYKDIVLIYKVEGQYVKLSRIGTAKQLGQQT